MDVKENHQEWARDRLLTAVDLIDEAIEKCGLHQESVGSSVGRMALMAYDESGTACFYTLLAYLMKNGAEAKDPKIRDAYFTVLNLVNTGLLATKEKIHAEVAE